MVTQHLGTVPKCLRLRVLPVNNMDSTAADTHQQQHLASTGQTYAVILSFGLISTKVTSFQANY